MTNELRTNESPAALLPARWYVVNRFGAALLCNNEADARRVARDSDIIFEGNDPHVAVQLAPVASESRGSVPTWKGRMNDLISAVNGAITDYADACRANARDGSTSRTARAVDEAIQNLRDEIAAAPTPPAVASGEPTAEQWRKLVDELATDLENEIENRRASELPRRIERDLEIVREARRMLARSAAAKGEG